MVGVDMCRPRGIEAYQFFSVIESPSRYLTGCAEVPLDRILEYDDYKLCPVIPVLVLLYMFGVPDLIAIG
jgi:hypothetical protein